MRPAYGKLTLIGSGHFLETLFAVWVRVGYIWFPETHRPGQQVGLSTNDSVANEDDILFCTNVLTTVLLIAQLKEAEY